MENHIVSNVAKNDVEQYIILINYIIKIITDSENFKFIQIQNFDLSMIKIWKIKKKNMKKRKNYWNSKDKD